MSYFTIKLGGKMTKENSLEVRTLSQKIFHHTFRIIGGLLIAAVMFFIIMFIGLSMLAEGKPTADAQAGVIFISVVIGIFSLWFGLSTSYNPQGFWDMLAGD